MRKRIMGPMNPSDAVRALRRAGMTEKAIADAIGASQSTVNRIARGQVPGYVLGKLLVDMAVHRHPEVLGDPPQREAAQ